MTSLLDTNAVIALLKNQSPKVRRRFRRTVARGASIAVPSVALFEPWYGVARSEHRRENTERLRIFHSADISHLPLEEEDAAVAGDLRATLERAGTPIGPSDLLIAAQALRAGATLVTADVSESAACLISSGRTGRRSHHPLRLEPHETLPCRTTRISSLTCESFRILPFPSPTPGIGAVSQRPGGGVSLPWP